MAELADDNNKDSRASFWGRASHGRGILNQYIDKASVGVLRALAVRLLSNIERIVLMVRIPEQFLLYEQMGLRNIAHHLWAALKTGTVKSIDTLTDDEREAYEAAVKKSYEQTTEAVDLDKMFEEWLGWAMQLKPQVIEKYSMEEPYKSLLYSGLIWAWIAFEVFASDLWEAVVNEATGKVRSRILRSISTSRPTIKVDYIAKYDYDLRGHLGTMMKDSCDFTSLDGIQKAYKLIFPKSQSISDALGKRELIELEASRHLIVHRYGIIDDEFRRKTKLKLKKGDELPIYDKQVLDYCNLTAEVALVLLLGAESLVRRKSPKKSEAEDV